LQKSQSRLHDQTTLICRDGCSVLRALRVVIKPRAGGFNPQNAKRSAALTIIASGPADIAIARRLLLNCIEPFFPAIDAP
jgi:hypothetical protein